MSDTEKSPYPPSGESRSTFEGHRFSDEGLQRKHAQLLREKEEPSEGFSPMPLFLVFLIMILSFWAGIYMVEYGGYFDAFHFDETAPAGMLVQDTGPQEVDMLALGRRVWSQNCAICHGADGAGQPGVFPPVARADWVQDNPERLIKLTLAGLAGPIEVNGRPYNNAMTAFGRLSDQQIAAVLTYIRTDPAFGNNSYPVSPELVAQVRAEWGDRRNAWTGPELEEIHGPVTGNWSPPNGSAPDSAEE